MAYVISNAAPLFSGFWKGVEQFLSALGQGFVPHPDCNARFDEILRLNKLTDEQLRELGVEREGIPRYVFRDIFAV
jgi:hypothetical protein